MRVRDVPPRRSPAETAPARDVAWAAALYLIATTVFLWPLLTGRIVAQTGALHFMAPFDAERPAEVVEPVNRMLDDQSREFLTFFLVARESIARGELPLWNPYVMAGTPLLADSQSALLFPLNVGHYVLPAPWGFAVSAFLKLFAASLATYLFGRQLCLSHRAACLAGLAYGFSSFNVFWLSHPHTNVTLLLPLTLLAVERIVGAPGGRNAALLAAAVALQLLGGHVELAFLVGVAAGFHLVVRLAQEGRRRVASLGSFVGGYALGAGMGAVMVLPFFEFLTESITWKARSADNPFIVDPVAIATLLVPRFFVSDGWGGGHVLHGLALYVGIVPLLLAIAGLIARPRGAALALAGLAVLGIVIAFDVGPLRDLLTRLPLFRQNPNYYTVIYAIFGSSVLAGFGCDALLSSPAAGTRPSRRSALGFAAGIVAAAVLAVVVAPGSLVERAVTAIGASDPAEIVRSMRSGATGAFAWLIAGVAAIAFGRRRGSPEMAWVVALLVFADLWFAGNRWNPSIRPERALPSAPLALREVREAATPTRVAGIGDVLPPNTGVYLGLQDIRGYDVPVIEGYHRFFREALRGRDTWWVYELPSFDASALPFYDLANVEWVLSRSELPLPLAAEGSSGVRVYRNPSALPRARLVERAEFVADGEAALARVLELGDGLRDVVVLEGPIPSAEAPPGAETGAAPATAGEAAPGEASVVRYEARRVEVEVRTPAPAWLVLSDSAYPGWRARIDGEETPIRRADSLFRAVRVPAGVHRVDFTYTPWSVRAGVLVSLVCTGIALWLWIRER